MKSEVQTCVTYGRLRCARAYAWAALVSGPSLSQKLSVGTLLGVGTCSGCRAVLVGLVRSALVDCARRWRSLLRTSMLRRSTARHVKQTAMLFFGVAAVAGLPRRFAHYDRGRRMAFVGCRSEL
jgi:hypothetical protein